jgi:hypothetical protein
MTAGDQMGVAAIAILFLTLIGAAGILAIGGSA